MLTSALRESVEFSVALIFAPKLRTFLLKKPRIFLASALANCSSSFSSVKEPAFTINSSFSQKLRSLFNA